MKDLSTVKGSMTDILQSNQETFLAAKTVSALVDVLKQLFAENNLNTPASNRLIQKVSKMRNVGDAHLVIYNSILKGCDLGVV